MTTRHEFIEDIRECILDGKKLNEAQQTFYDRIANVYRFLRKYKVKRSVIKQLQRLDDDYTETAILRDIKYAESLFCEIEKYDKEMLRSVVIEGALRDIKMLNKLIYSNERYKNTPTSELTMLLKAKRDAEKIITEAAQLGETNVEMPDVSKFQQLIVNVAPDNFTTLFLNQIDSMKRGGVLDLTELMPEEKILQLE